MMLYLKNEMDRSYFVEKECVKLIHLKQCPQATNMMRKKDVEGETAESSHSRDPRSEATQVLS